MALNEIKTITMKMTSNTQGDGLFLNRLLSYLKSQFPFKINKIGQIRKNVFIITSDSDHFILKGFPSYHRLKLQETYTASLKKEGFQYTYLFYEFAKNPPLYFEQNYYGCLEYIPPSQKTFSYDNFPDRCDGLKLLEQYHTTTKLITNRYRSNLGHFKLLEKWRERSARFLNNVSIIKFFVQKEMIDELMTWADWALKGLEKEKVTLDNVPPVILHGDVAHHNFMRSEDGQLYLIDFDLISIGHERADYLQYANRILPFLDWSIEKLAQHEKLKPYLNDKIFLYSLAFPTDIFREWNRLIRNRQFMNSNKVRNVLDLTVGQFKERQNFYHELKSLVND
ncbi:phosphotransferase [Cytobacillus sp. FJAT-54145]|uniref:Phosphotransferase n=1 Tax=Cytobacillus spartinae TaxID=3299023 RepID=A0ABW6KJS0_9BACI